MKMRTRSADGRGILTDPKDGAYGTVPLETK